MTTKEETPQQTELNLKDVLTSLAVESEGELNDNPATSIELTHEIVNQMFNNDNLDMITDVTDKQIQGLLRLSVINHIFFDNKESILTTFMSNFKRLNISRTRQSRKELVKAIFSASNANESEYSESSRFKRFLG